MNKIEEYFQKMKKGEITKLKYYMIEKKISTGELASSAGINKRTLDDYVSGRRDLARIPLADGLRIAEILEVDIYNLL